MTPLLSILIPTVVGREEQFEKLFNKVCNQSYKEGEVKGVDCGFGDFISIYSIGLSSEVEIIWAKDNKQITIGEKREMLYKEAKGLYSFQIDDDDSIAPNAIELILNAIKSNPEVSCITFKENCMMNGEYKSSNHSLKYSQWMDNQDGYSYVRSPFYKDVIRTDIAKSVPFHRVRYNEDELFAKDIYPLLTSEIHIDEELYYYIYEPKESHNERYGIHD